MKIHRLTARRISHCSKNKSRYLFCIPVGWCMRQFFSFLSQPVSKFLLIGGDDVSNDVIALVTCFTLVSRRGFKFKVSFLFPPRRQSVPADSTEKHPSKSTTEQVRNVSAFFKKITESELLVVYQDMNNLYLSIRKISNIYNFKLLSYCLQIKN